MPFAFILALVAFFVTAFSPAPSNAIVISKLDDELMCLALNGYYEARGESPRGELMVNQVVLNRVEDGRFGDTICEVVKDRAGDRSRRCQFDWVCGAAIRRPTDMEAFERSLTLAQELLYRRNQMPDLTNGATHYHHRRVKPNWSRVFTKTQAYGSHIFYIDY